MAQLQELKEMWGLHRCCTEGVECMRNSQLGTLERQTGGPLHVLEVHSRQMKWKGGVGAAAVLYRRGRRKPEKVLRYHLGAADDYTNYEAEAAGLLLALRMLWRQHVVGRLNVTIYVDNQALLRAVNGSGARPGQYLMTSC
jgi:hypothetical protein